MKKTIKTELSIKSLKETRNKLLEFKNSYSKGIDSGVKKATELMYQLVLSYCADSNISNPTGRVHYEYDEQRNVGRVYTNDMVIILNEMGTGITGSNNPHPSPSASFKGWKYDVNEHGEKGWYYPKEDGTYGWTKGLPSKHMFYDAFQDIQKQLGEIVAIEIRKSVGDLY